MSEFAGEPVRPDHQFFGQRDRAESFGAIADQYDRARPPYPDALILALATRGGTHVLDVGCGTGKASVLLAARGLTVLGVEVDPGMAGVARTHGIPVEVGAFESWDDAGRRFDLVTCAQAWHWVEPDAGARKAFAVLRPGGSVALFWNVHWVDDEVRERFAPIYAELAPSIRIDSRGGTSGRTEMYRPSLTAAGFVDVQAREYPWEHRYRRAEFLDLLGTYSDHHLLPDAQRARLLAALGAVVDELGGTLAMHYETHLISARVPVWQA